MPARILVVDDDPDACDLLAFVLSHEGYAVTCAEDGQQALDMTRQEPPDLIIADLVMPNVSGVELINIVHDDPALRHIPVLVVTGRHSGSIGKAIRAGARGYLHKPVALRPLLKLIEQTLAST